jgi:hypothetical protein
MFSKIDSVRMMKSFYVSFSLVVLGLSSVLLMFGNSWGIIGVLNGIVCMKVLKD